MAVAYYTLERTTVVDAAGTRLDETMFTTSRERLEHAIRAAIERSSGYVEDNLRVAWWVTLERGENALAEHSPRGSRSPIAARSGTPSSPTRR